MSEINQNTLPINELTRANDAFRHVLRTGERMQLVLMTIPAGKSIGGEVHEGHDQVLIFVEGKARATIGELESEVGAGDLAFVPSGAYHNFENTGDSPLKLYTFYAPPEHEEGTEHASKAEAEA
jgi:mannose-6-phosphate isomerase-like protein (cupin superfamily)